MIKTCWYLKKKNEDFLLVLVLTLTKKVYFMSINETQQKNVITFGGCSPDSVWNKCLRFLLVHRILQNHQIDYRIKIILICKACKLYSILLSSCFKRKFRIQFNLLIKKGYCKYLDSWSRYSCF